MLSSKYAQGMPTAIVIFVFALILVCLGLLVRWEYRRMLRSREMRMFDRLNGWRFSTDQDKSNAGVERPHLVNSRVPLFFQF